MSLKCSVIEFTRRVFFSVKTDGTTVPALSFRLLGQPLNKTPTRKSFYPVCNTYSAYLCLVHKICCVHPNTPTMCPAFDRLLLLLILVWPSFTYFNDSYV